MRIGEYLTRGIPGQRVNAHLNDNRLRLQSLISHAVIFVDLLRVVPMLFSVTSVAYLGAAALYHGDIRRCGLRAASTGAVHALRYAGYLLLLLTACIAIAVWGAERGIPLALGAICLAAPLSLLLATRSPRWHLRSAPLAVLGFLLGFAL
jgi:hypothetical protein